MAHDFVTMRELNVELSQISTGSEFTRAAESDRLIALRSCGILDTAPENAFDDVARIAAAVCEAPMALVSFVDEHRQWFKASVGPFASETPRNVSICAHAIQSADIFLVPDASKDPRFRDNPLVVGPPNIRFYAGAVLEYHGFALGTVCVIDDRPRPSGLTANQSESLGALARTVVDQIKLKRANVALEHSLATNRRQTALFDVALSKMRQGLCFFGGDQRLLVCNAQYASMYGLTSDETRPGTTIGEIFKRRYQVGSCPERPEAEFLRWRKDIASRSEPSDTQVYLIDGRTIRIHHEPMPDGGWVATHDDITAEVKAAELLRAGEERYRALVEANASAVWLAAPTGEMLDGWGEGWAELFGRPAREQLGFAWLDSVHPEDRNSLATSWGAALASGCPSNDEFRTRRADGTFRWVISRGVPVRGPDGQVREWVGSVTDIHDTKSMALALSSREERFRLATRATRDAIWDWDLTTDCIEFGDALCATFGYGEDALGRTGAWWIDSIHPADRDRVLRSIRAAIDGNAEFWSDEYRFRRGDGTYAEVVDRGSIIRSQSGEAVRMVGAIQDNSKQRQSEKALRDNEERLRLALSAGRMFAWDRDLGSDHVRRSENSQSMLGLGSGPGAEILERVHPDDRDRVQAALRSPRSGFSDLEFRCFRPDGELMWLGMRAEKTSAERLIGVAFDITDRKTTEAEIRRLADQDPLTGLPNRRQFAKCFDEALEKARAARTAVSLLLIDLDHFKDVNDSLGHHAGDALLKETSRRLQSLKRECDAVARIGGDEFAMLVVEPLTLDNAVRFAEHVAEEVKKPFEYEGRLIASRISVGVAGFPEHDATESDLMKDADIALYRAKALGRNRVVAYVPQMRAETEHRMAIISEAGQALAQHQFVPFYQPKVCLSSGRIAGFEALARWQHPTKGILTPGYFGAAFEDVEFAANIGEAMLASVAADVVGWLARSFDCGRVAVNFSSAQFARADLARSVLDTLRRQGTPVRNLEVEVTEGVFLGATSENVLSTLAEFNRAGIKVALDDFGTGFASLTHLKQYPVDHIKIDQSFVRGLGHNPGDEAIVSAVIGLAKSMKMQVTAEGVETEAQARILREMRCDFAQGYLFAKPMPATGVPFFLENWRAMPKIGPCPVAA